MEKLADNRDSKKLNITTISVVFIAYIAILSCKTTIPVLYGGYAVLMGLLFVRILFWDNCRIIIPSYTKRLFLFVGYCAASGIWAYDSSLTSVQIPLLLACAFLVAFVGDYVIKKNAAEIVLWCIAICGLALSVYVVYEYGGFSAFYTQATLQSGSLEAQRLGADVNNTNVIGLQCVFSTVILIYYAVVRGKKYCYLLMLMPFITAMATGSRKAILLLAVGLVMLAYYKLTSKSSGDSKQLAKVYFGIIAVVVGLVILFSMDITQTAVDRILKGFGWGEYDGGMDSTTQMRYNMITNGLEHFWQYPYLGWGLGNSRMVNVIYLGFNSYSHNDFVELLVNGGAFGFVLYYGLIFKIIKHHIYFYKKNKSDSVVFISFTVLIMLLVSNIACVTYYGSISTFIYFILWITVLETRKRAEKNEVSSESSEQTDK
ncbi:MAG: O-antigen ligase family protein [Clostridia bacterium]|nr:O-antigen ligase family protein [Clostridia bacterium]